MKEKILLVDDEEEIISFMKDALEAEGYDVLTASNGYQALEQSKLLPSLILLDVMMPEMNGFELCQQLRQTTNSPILFLSACQSETDRIKGLAVGGDDYLLKPFSLAELKARIQAHLRREKRRHRAHSQGILSYPPLVIDCKGHSVQYNGQNIPLTNKEFKVVELLALHQGQVFSREHIYEKIWGYDAEGDDSTVTEHIKKIRAKLAVHAQDKSYIQTVWGIGYKWDVH